MLSAFIQSTLLHHKHFICTTNKSTLNLFFYVNPDDKLNQNYYSPTAEAEAQICLTDWETVLRLCPSIYSIIQLIGAINWTPGEGTQGSFLQQVLLATSAGGLVRSAGRWRGGRRCLCMRVRAGGAWPTATIDGCLLVTDHSGSISDTGSVTGWNVTSSIIKTFIKPQLTECQSVALTSTPHRHRPPPPPPHTHTHAHPPTSILSSICSPQSLSIPPFSHLPSLVRSFLHYIQYPFSPFFLLYTFERRGGEALMCAQFHIGGFVK